MKNNNKFPALLQLETSKESNTLSKFIAELIELTDIKTILDKWYYNSLLTPATKHKEWELSALKAYLIKRKELSINNAIAKTTARIQCVSDACKTVTSISISIEWVKNRTWGGCPKAEIRVCYSDNTCNSYESGRITGCGYDKESTAVAQALNQSNDLLHMLYAVKESAPQAQNRDLLGYGSGYGNLPYFEGGVGVSCYPHIFEKIGLKWEGISHGKTYDVYQVTKNIAA